VGVDRIYKIGGAQAIAALAFGTESVQRVDKIKQRLAAEKNERYVNLVKTVTQQELLPGALDCLRTLKKHGVKIVLGSASKNAIPVLEQTGIVGLFDAIIDGTKISKVKPDPEVFLKGAQKVAVPAQKCVVFEDSVAGIEAAKAGGMFAVGVGEAKMLGQADLVVKRLNINEIYKIFFTMRKTK
jgi:beta-phosphoglucomutase